MALLSGRNYLPNVAKCYYDALTMYACVYVGVPSDIVLQGLSVFFFCFCLFFLEGGSVFKTGYSRMGTGNLGLL